MSVKNKILTITFLIAAIFVGAVWCSLTSKTLDNRADILQGYEFEETAKGELYIKNVLSPLAKYDTREYYNSKGEKITEYSNGRVFLPDEFEGKKVVGISRNAFTYGLGGKTAVIPASIETIESEAFAGSGVAGVVFEQNSRCRYIGDRAFAYTTMIGEAEIPSSVEYLGKSAFEGSFIKNLSFSANSRLTAIKKRAFANCRYLGAIRLPRSIVKIEEEAFSGANLPRLDFEENSRLEEVGKNAFKCALKQIYIPKSLKKCEGAFYNAGTQDTFSRYYIFYEGAERGEEFEISSGIAGFCKEGDEYGVIKKTFVKGIINQGGVRYALKNMSAAVVEATEEVPREFSLPSEINSLPVTEIYSFAFEYAGNFLSLTLPDTVTEIDEYAFGGNLIENFTLSSSIERLVFRSMFIRTKKLVLPPSVKFIENEAFYDPEILCIGEGNFDIAEFAFLSGAHFTIAVDLDDAPAAFHSGWECGNSVIYSYGDLKSGAGFLYGENDEGITLVRYTGGEEEIEIPLSIEGRPVVKIAKDCFFDDFDEQRISIYFPVEIEDGAVSAKSVGKKRILFLGKGVSYPQSVFASWVTGEIQ
ncbi:MAG: leucine-rich repeat protein [Clostridia bacterium]|nr:leucine-rich repeat protein [Clostridia bacterium]